MDDVPDDVVEGGGSGIGWHPEHDMAGAGIDEGSSLTQPPAALLWRATDGDLADKIECGGIAIARRHRRDECVPLLAKIRDVPGAVAGLDPAGRLLRCEPDAAWSLPAEIDRRAAGRQRRRHVRRPLERT